MESPFVRQGRGKNAGWLFVYTMSQVDKRACTQLSIWRTNIIELISEMYTMSQVDKCACTQLSIWRLVKMDLQQLVIRNKIKPLLC